jgi:hypothetical protein
MLQCINCLMFAVRLWITTSPYRWPVGSLPSTCMHCTPPPHCTKDVYSPQGSTRDLWAVSVSCLPAVSSADHLWHSFKLKWSSRLSSHLTLSSAGEGKHSCDYYLIAWRSQTSIQSLQTCSYFKPVEADTRCSLFTFKWRCFTGRNVIIFVSLQLGWRWELV